MGSVVNANWFSMSGSGKPGSGGGWAALVNCCCQFIPSDLESKAQRGQSSSATVIASLEAESRLETRFSIYPVYVCVCVGISPSILFPKFSP